MFERWLASTSLAVAALVPAPLLASGMGASYGSALQWAGFFIFWVVLFTLPLFPITFVVARIVHGVKKNPTPTKRSLKLALKVYLITNGVAAVGILLFFGIASLLK